MNRIRIATVVAVLATGLFLLGCGAGDPAKTSWHAAPAQPGGVGGGESVDASLVSTRPSTSSGIPGVLATTGSEAVALTFDDGPDPNYTPQVLAMLRTNRVKATFCLVGVQAEQFPHLVRDIVAEGHTLCNHSWKHDLKLGTRGEDAIRADLQRTNDAIAAAAPGAPVRYFRHPGGNWTPRAVATAAAMGMASIGWEVDTGDWNVAKHPAGPQMRDHVLTVLRTAVKPGSIVLAHDAGGDRRGTLAAYEVALPELAAKFSLVALPV
jgi:peptidoglycan/xylan/chitin deacetylase (PgdA/CDA1 family)